jgi:hypothetical protein
MIKIWFIITGNGKASVKEVSRGKLSALSGQLSAREEVDIS